MAFEIQVGVSAGRRAAGIPFGAAAVPTAVTVPGRARRGAGQRDGSQALVLVVEGNDKVNANCLLFMPLTKTM